MIAGSTTCQFPLTVRRALLHGAESLLGAGIDTHQLDAEILLRCALNVRQWELYANMECPLDPGQSQRFQQLIARRAAHEPIAYITGHKEFWSLDFVVTTDVLIPRPETETVVEIALRHSRSGGEQRAIDLGTGSGVLAICLAKECPGMTVSAVDVSSDALAVAQLNSTRHGVASTLDFLNGDLFEPIFRYDFNLIVANPPYVRSQDLATLAPEIRQWEPVIALDGGIDGLDTYRRIIGQAHRYLADGGNLILEIGADMATPVSELIAGAGCYASISVHRDYAGRERVISVTKL